MDFTEKSKMFMNCNLSELKKHNKMLIVFVLGPIGAGKSYYINNLLSKNKIDDELIFLSSDNLMKTTKMTYEQTRNQMGNIIQECVEKRKSFITEGTGQHDDLYDLFSLYKKMDFIDLKIIYIDVDMSIALERNESRTRVLSHETVLEVHFRCSKRRDLWKDFDCTYIDYKDLFTKDITFENIY